MSSLFCVNFFLSKSAFHRRAGIRPQAGAGVPGVSAAGARVCHRLRHRDRAERGEHVHRRPLPRKREPESGAEDTA